MIFEVTCLLTRLLPLSVLLSFLSLLSHFSSLVTTPTTTLARISFTVLNACHRSHHCGPWPSRSPSQEAGRQAISAETAEKAKGKTGQEGAGKALSSCHASQYVAFFCSHSPDEYNLYTNTNHNSRPGPRNKPIARLSWG